MEISSYSFSNEQFRIKKIKEKLSKTDFTYYKRLVDRINNFKESLTTEEVNQNGASVIINHGVQKVDDDEPSFIEYLKAEFEAGLFNLKGKLKKLKKQEINSDFYFENFHKARFDISLEIKDDNAKFKINLNRVENFLFEKFDKMPKDTMISFLNLKTLYEEGNIVFRQCKETEIIFHGNMYHDFEKPLVMNYEMRKYYEKEKKRFRDKKVMEKSRLGVRQPSYYIEGINTADKNDSKEAGRLNELVTLADSFADISELLVKDVEHSIYGMTNVMRINSNQSKKDVFGMIKSYKVEEKLETIEIISLKDSNSIKVLHYNKNVNLRLKENMIVLIRGVNLKVNKNFDIYLENPDPNLITFYDKLSEEDANKFKKFRCNKNMEYGCIIELTKPVLIRTIQKYLVTIKKIFKIMAIYEKDSYVISGFPDLKLIAKCLVDDGSFEAQVYIQDHTVVNLFKLDKETLSVLYIFYFRKLISFLLILVMLLFMKNLINLKYFIKRI